VTRVPGNARGLLLVPTENLHLFSKITDVEELQQMVARRGRQPVAVEVPLQVHDRALVGVPEDKAAL
jgi:hypothetical protein